jgi:uracil-DNA glycosylase family 4
VSRDDGLELAGAWATAVNRCAPPRNRPSPQERDNCLPFLAREISALPDVRVVVALGAFAWDGALRALAGPGRLQSTGGKPRFGHGVEAAVGPYALIGCFHPSQQNTFTGKLTESMIDAVFRAARERAGLAG